MVVDWMTVLQEFPLAKVIFVALVAGEYCINHFICLNNFVLVMEVNFPEVLGIY
jgi:hypothetical protein